MDTGQMLVISMLVVAFIGALIAFTVEANREENVQSREPAKPIRWINISSTDAAAAECSWVAQISSALDSETVELSNLAAPGATASQQAQVLTTSENEAEIDLATVWIGPEDFLAGTQILEFEECLNSILSWLSGHGASLFVGTMPDLTPELVAAKLADPVAVRPVFEQWNATIARLTDSHSGMLVDLSQPQDLSRTSIRYLYTTQFDPNQDAQSFVARQFISAMTDALEWSITRG